ncbi:MAG: hypothetical protein M1814_001738 [Vezdaea aestivalis]|nr:MAG: hypothetical protein M1814_001738 [Vezdaea aestivalis]
MDSLPKHHFYFEVSNSAPSNRHLPHSEHQKSSFFSAKFLVKLFLCCLTMYTIVNSLFSKADPSDLLPVFQIREPVPTSSSCQVHLMTHSFGWSYGKPFVAPYAPPDCDFDQIVIDFTVVSAGRQFDRLGTMWLGDIEVWRTSTAEPTLTGIQWTYQKDVSHLLALFQQPQTLIFDLGNLIDDTYTAPFNATLTATFSKAELGAQRADSILAISARRQNLSSAFTLPSDVAASTINFPQNVRKAVVSLSACGQADEEFWFGNVYESDRTTFPKIGSMLGYSPFREVQLYIDGELAGVAWPFPIIFTGGVVPGLWRPVVGLDAFDLREQEIDISAWLPRLCDGDPSGHVFEIRVAGIQDNGKGVGQLSKTVGNSWIISGKIFLWLDPPGSITRGALFFADSGSPSISMTSAFAQNTSGVNTTLQYQTNVQRYLMVNSVVFTATSFVHHKWTQVLMYSSWVNFTNTGGVQVIDQVTKGLDKSSSGYQRSYHYPIWCNTSFNLDPATGAFTIDAPIRRSLELETYGPAVFPTGLEAFTTTKDGLSGSVLKTTQNGSAHYLGVPSKHKAYGHGTTDQVFEFQGQGNSQSWLPLYSRSVKAINGSIARDVEMVAGNCTRDISVNIPTSTGQHGQEMLFFDASTISRDQDLGAELDQDNYL